MFLIDLFRNCLKRLIYGARSNEENYINYLRKKGIEIGSGFRMFSPETITIDIQNPHMIKIGDNVRLTKGCTILTHDYSFSVLAGYSGEIYSGIGEVILGNNIFIGMDSIIMKGSHIGNNVIVGAKSVVSGLLDSNAVYAGCPARKIMNIEEFAERRRKSQVHEAKTYIKNYIDMHQRLPHIQEMKEYFFLFEGGVEDDIIQSFIDRTGYPERVHNAYSKSERKFKSVEELYEFENEE